MNDSRKQISDLRDIAHAAILLILVPVIFYGGYQLVSRSADTQPEPLNRGIKVGEAAKRAAASVFNRSSPPPGVVWIEQVDRLKAKLTSINSTNHEAIDRLDSQLSAIRQHCQTHTNDLPASVTIERPLGQMLLAIAEEMQSLLVGATSTASLQNWETAYDDFESKRLAQQSISVSVEYQLQAAPVRQAHATQLAALTRQNNELADELQRILDSIERKERDARQEVAKHQRYQAYLSDKAEIERLLSPFTTPGYTQLLGGPYDWKRTAEASPISYRDLERTGALATDIDGIRVFARIGGMPTHFDPKSARPLGAFPAYYDTTLSNPTQLETIKRAQQLIKQHSVYLIESGLLQP